MPIPSMMPSMPPIDTTSLKNASLPSVIQPNAQTTSESILSSFTNMLSSKSDAVETKTELWSFANALFFLILIILVFIGILFSATVFSNIQHIKDDWANQRCSPTIMPFASMFGYNTKDNFEFCMGKVFTIYANPYLGSMGTMFGQFTTVLQSLFDSLNSMRNTVATLGGGINVVFQEFTDRISNFFFKLRLSAIHLKSLFMRMYAVLFSVMYMGTSAMTGMSSFTNTFLFSFLDTFCFPANTEIIVQGKGRMPITEVKMGDVLLPGGSTVTATFQFYSRGQPMVKLGPVTVSTNHYVMHNGKPIKAGEHPSAIQLGPWDSDELLYCFNTDNHIIPVEYLSFIDYDETPDGDEESMNFLDARLNSTKMRKKKYAFTECGFALGPDTKIKTKHGLVHAKDMKVGDKLTTGSEVVGVIRKQIHEFCTVNGTEITPATLFWQGTEWVRYGEVYPFVKQQKEFVSFVVVPNSQLELEDGTRVRDYMELCSPDAETYYTAHLEGN